MSQSNLPYIMATNESGVQMYVRYTKGKDIAHLSRFYDFLVIAYRQASFLITWENLRSIPELEF